MKNRGRSQLVIGLDAMEWSLVRRWAGEGKLPALSRLMETGTRADLASPASQLPDTVWPSVYTGMNPAKHERYYYVQYEPSTQGLRCVPDDALRGTPFWAYLGQAGHRVMAVDPPKFPLSRQPNVLQIANWGAHATHTARGSHPDSVLTDIHSRFGDFPVSECDAAAMTPRGLALLRRRILEGVRMHGEAFRWLMTNREWDEMFAVFSAPHCVGHHFWHAWDVSHPRHQEVRQHGLSDTIEAVYRAIDRELGDMLGLVGPETRIMIFSGHGMGPLCHGSWNLQDMLDGLGHGAQHGPNASGRTELKGKRNVMRTLRRVLPGALQFRMLRILPELLHDQALFFLNAGRRRWNDCRAFAVPNNDSVGAIRINLKGRDKHGVVEPGQEYQQLCDQIATDLRGLVDPATGNRVVSCVSMPRKEFHGPFLEHLPDLTVLWAQSFPWSSVHSARLGTLTVPAQDRRTGSHRPGGFLLLAGPGIAAGAELTGCSVYDLAPTVLAAAGIPVPAHMDGRPLCL